MRFHPGEGCFSMRFACPETVFSMRFSLRPGASGRPQCLDAFTNSMRSMLRATIFMSARMHYCMCFSLRATNFSMRLRRRRGEFSMRFGRAQVIQCMQGMKAMRTYGMLFYVSSVYRGGFIFACHIFQWLASDFAACVVLYGRMILVQR